MLFNLVIFLFFAGSYAFNLDLWDMFGSYQLAVPLGLVFLIMFSVSGTMLKAARFFAYGILVFTSFLFFEYLFMQDLVKHHGIPAAAITSGALIVLSGAFYCRRFIGKLYRIENE